MSEDFITDLLDLAKKHSFDIAIPTDAKDEDIATKIFIDINKSLITFEPSINLVSTNVNGIILATLDLDLANELKTQCDLVPENDALDVKLTTMKLN